MSHETRIPSFINQKEWHERHLRSFFETQISWFNRNATQGIHGESTGKIQVAGRFLFFGWIDPKVTQLKPAAGVSRFSLFKNMQRFLVGFSVPGARKLSLHCGVYYTAGNAGREMKV